MKIKLILVFVILKINLFAWELDTAKVFLLGGSKDEIVYDAIPTNDSGFFLVGTTGSFGQYFSSVYAIKLDSLGKKMWSNTYGVNNINYGYGAAEIPGGNILIAGYSFDSLDYNGMLYKLDRQGNQIFSKEIGGDNWDFFKSITKLEENKFLICGNTYSNNDNHANAYLVCVDTLGNLLWQNNYNNDGAETFFNSITILNGVIYCFGYLEGINGKKYVVYKISSDGTEINKVIDSTPDQESFFNSGITSRTGELVGVGSAVSPIGNNDFNLFYPHFDGDLNQLSSSIEGGTNIEYASDIIQLPSGDFSIIGYTSGFGGGGKDIAQYRFGELGGWFQNGSTYGNVNDEEAFAIATNKNNRILFAGYSKSYNAIEKDACWITFRHPILEEGYFQTTIRNNDNLNPVNVGVLAKNENYFDYVNGEIFFHFNKNSKVEIFALDGRLIYSGVSTNPINCDFISPGLFILKVSNDQINFSKAFFK